MRNEELGIEVLFGKKFRFLIPLFLTGSAGNRESNSPKQFLIPNF
jgi:hypothetical protein